MQAKTSQKDRNIVKVKITGTDDEYDDTYREEKKFYLVEDKDFNIDNIIEFYQRLDSNEEFKTAVWEDWKNSHFDMAFIHYLEIDGVIYTDGINHLDLYEAGKLLDEICDDNTYSEMRIDRDGESVYIINA